VLVVLLAGVAAFWPKLNPELAAGLATLELELNEDENPNGDAVDVEDGAADGILFSVLTGDVTVLPPNENPPPCVETKKHKKNIFKSLTQIFTTGIRDTSKSSKLKYKA